MVKFKQLTEFEKQLNLQVGELEGKTGISFEKITKLEDVGPGMKKINIYIYMDLCCSKVIKNGLGQKIGMSILHNISNDILAPNKISRSFP